MQFLGMALFLALLACVLGEALKQHFYVDSPDPTNPANLDLSAIFAAQAEPVSKPRSHQRRWGGFPPGPAGDALWNTAKCKGRKFMAQMSYSDYDAGQALPVPASTVQSPWRFSKCSEYRSLRYERITNTMHADDLIPWGYFFSGATQEYTNLETGGYWGVADLFRHMGISDRCEQDGGQWYAGSFTHYRPGPPGFPPNPSKQQQTYIDPNGVKRRVSLPAHHNRFQLRL
jgi:hypothetical protein